MDDLQQIPGVGESIAGDLRTLGYERVSDLVDADPEQLYADFCKWQGLSVDRCLLYVFRCAVYYASHPEHDPKLLKWWNWSDKKMAEREPSPV